MVAVLRLNLGWLDYLLVAIYFVFVLGIGSIARSQISNSLDFFLSGRRLPAWVTGLAFISANLGAVEIMGMAANGAEVGLSTMHYYWIGAVPGHAVPRRGDRCRSTTARRCAAFPNSCAGDSAPAPIW